MLTFHTRRVLTDLEIGRLGPRVSGALDLRVLLAVVVPTPASEVDGIAQHPQGVSLCRCKKRRRLNEAVQLSSNS